MDGGHCTDVSAGFPGPTRPDTMFFSTSFPRVSSDGFGQFPLRVNKLDTREKPTWLQRTSRLKTVAAMRRAAASSRTRSHVVSSSVVFILRSGTRSCGSSIRTATRQTFVPSVKLHRRWMIIKEPPWRAVNG